MAEQVRKFSVDVRHGATAIEKLAKATSDYTEKVREQRRQFGEYNKQTERVSKQIKNIADNLKAVKDATKTSVTQLEKHATALDNNSTRVRALSQSFIDLKDNTIDLTNATISASDGLYNVRGATAVANRALALFAASVDRTVVNQYRMVNVTNTMVNAIKGHRVLLNADSRALDANVGALLRLKDVIDDIIGGMKTKNGVLESQAKAVDKDTQASHKLYISYTRLFIVQTLHRLFYEFVRAVKEAYQETRQLSIAIAELQTIQGNSAKTAQEWRNEILELSGLFGRSNTEVAAGAYEALSNQVVKARDSYKFMKDELQLSITTQASLSEAVNATTSVINAFGLSSSDANEINAKLFKTVELGRIRLNELGSQFGRVSILSKTLGVTFDEQQAALTLLTRKGLAAQQAQILLVNVINALIKPSKEMQEIFEKWGVSSGGAAIQAFGFANVLRRLAAEAAQSGDRLSEIADAFKDLRALTGAAALTQSFDEFERDLFRIKDSTKDFSNAVKITTESMGQRVGVELQKLKNHFITAFGDPTLRLFVRFSEAIGGLDKGLKSALDVVRLAIEGYVAYRVAIGLTMLATIKYDVVVKSLSTTINSANVRLAASRLLLAGLAVVLIEATLASNRYTESTLEAAQAQARLGREFRDSEIARQIRNITEHYKQLQTTTEDVFGSVIGYYAALRRANNTLSDDFEKNFERITKALRKASDRPLDNLTKQLSELQRESERLNRQAEKFAEKVRKEQEVNANKNFDRNIQNLSPADQARQIELEKRRLHQETLDLLAKGEDELAQIRSDRVDELADKQNKILQDLHKEALKKKEEITTIVPVTDAFGRQKYRKRVLPRAEFEFPLENGVRFKPPRAVVYEPIFKRKTQKVSRPDAEEDAKILVTLNALEQERLQHVNDRIAAEQQFIERQKAAAAAEQERIESQQENVRTLRDLLAEIDAFDPKQANAAGNFDALVKRAEEVIGATNLDEGAKLELLRQAYAARIELQRKAANDAAAAEIEASQNQLLQAKQDQQRLLQEQENALKARTEQLKNFIELNREKFAELNAIFTGNTFRRDALLGGAPVDANKGGVDFLNNAGNNVADRQRLIELNQLIEKQIRLNNSLTAQQAQGVFNKDTLLELKSVYEQIVELVQKIDPRDLASFAPEANLFNLATAIKNIQFDLGFGGGEFNNKGKLALPGQEPVVDVIKGLLIEFNNLAEAQQNIVKTQQEMERLSVNLTRQQQVQQQLKATFPDLAREMEQANNVVVNQQQNINALLDQQEQKIRRIIDLLRQQQQIGQPIATRAFGGTIHGRGIDRVPALLAPRETVMTQLATRQFGPFLNMINHMPPTFRSGGGSVSFGDVHITAGSGTSREQAIEIAAHLQKLARQGRI